MVLQGGCIEPPIPLRRGTKVARRRKVFPLAMCVVYLNLSMHAKPTGCLYLIKETASVLCVGGFQNKCSTTHRRICFKIHSTHICFDPPNPEGVQGKRVSRFLRLCQVGIRYLGFARITYIILNAGQARYGCASLH